MQRPKDNIGATKLWSVQQVGERLNLSTRTIRRWIDQGELPVYRLGRQIRISDKDLDTFLKLRRFW